MEIWVNDCPIELFTGARVKNALLKYSEEEYNSLLSGLTIVVDKRGHVLDPDGELTSGSRLFTKEKNIED